MFAIFKREVRSCFHGMIGYVLTAFLLVASAIYFVALNLGHGLPDFGYYTLYNTIFMLLFYFPVLTMRSFAEERRTRTDQLLLTSPVPVTGIVLGKFFALCVVFALPCVVDAVMILTLWALGATAASTLANFAALLCYYLLGCAAIAIGVFLSSLTENQIIAAVAGAAALLGLYFHRAWSAGMSFTRLLGYAVLCQVLTVAAGLLFVALLLGIFWLAHKLGHIEGERWEQYFQSVSTAGLLLRVGAVMAVALAAVAALSVPLFARLGFQEPGLLAALFFVARGAYLLNKFSRRRDELIQKLLKLKR